MSATVTRPRGGVGVAPSLDLASVRGVVLAGTYHWSGVAGTNFWVDPVERMLAVLMIQAPMQREYYRVLFRDLVYAAVTD